MFEVVVVGVHAFSKQKKDNSVLREAVSQR